MSGLELLPRSPALRVRLPMRAAPLAVAIAVAAAYLILEPRPVDLAAAFYRTDLFARHGLTLWDGGWYAGEHTFSYSVVFPPLAWLVGPRLLGAIATVASAAVFARLLRSAYPARAPYGALWFAVTTATLLMSSRLPFALGVALGLASLLALQRRSLTLACALALACSLSSPIAGLFLLLAAVAASAAGDRGAPAVTLAALVPVLALALAFPAAGWEPFTISGILPLAGFCALALLAVPRRERALRIGLLLYAGGGLLAYLVHTPMGGNALRLGWLFGGPLLVCVVPVPHRVARRAALGALLAACAVWPWLPALGDVEQVAGDPAAGAAFYRPLLAALPRPGPWRVEIPFTRSHWETSAVAVRYPLARGWDRQLDIGRNPLFYGAAPLDARTYRAWLDDHAVRFVALPHAAFDYAGQAEARLVGRGLPYLRLRTVAGPWRVYQVVDAAPLVLPSTGATALTLTNESLTVLVRHPSASRVAVAWSPYWQASGACVSRDGQWTRVTARRTGLVTLRFDFSLDRVFDRGPRCSP